MTGSVTTASEVERVGAYEPPKSPSDVEATGVPRSLLLELTLRLTQNLKDFTTEWLSNRLCLPTRLVLDLTEELRVERLLATEGQSGRFGLRMSITDRGRDRTVESKKSTSYAGPAPVTLTAYVEHLERQLDVLPQVTRESVSASLSDLVLPDETLEIAGLARSSSRSLFLHGPPGNGKTSLGQRLHEAAAGLLWVPYCIVIDHSIVRIFDPESHARVQLDPDAGISQSFDRRWIPIRRPFVIAGGELTIDALDLSYQQALGYYEAPLHVKANGGTLLIDDFGHQLVDPQELLNRWIHPLESKVDYLTLTTGQKFPVPFRTMLIISTNLDPDKTMDPAFLRRMGYRVHMDNPTPERYEVIFERYAEKVEVKVPEGLLANLLKRYVAEGRPMRSCEARDLIERARDICDYRALPFRLDESILDLAWRGYFGEMPASLSEPAH